MAKVDPPKLPDFIGNDDRPLYTYNGGFYQVPQSIPPYYTKDWSNEQILWAP